MPLLVVIALVGGALALPIERASAAGAAPTGFSVEVSADAKSGAVRVAGVPPTGFSDTVAISGLVQPTAVAFGGDGRVFVAEKSGLIKVFDSLSDTTPSVFADLRTQVHNFWDRGMLGLTLDPQFPTRPYVYALYTYDAVPGGTAPRWGTAGGTSDGCPNPPGATVDGCVVQARPVPPHRKRQPDDGLGAGARDRLVQSVPESLDRHRHVRSRRCAVCGGRRRRQLQLRRLRPDQQRVW